MSPPRSTRILSELWIVFTMVRSDVLLPAHLANRIRPASRTNRKGFATKDYSARFKPTSTRELRVLLMNTPFTSTKACSIGASPNDTPPSTL